MRETFGGSWHQRPRQKAHWEFRANICASLDGLSIRFERPDPPGHTHSLCRHQDTRLVPPKCRNENNRPKETACGSPCNAPPVAVPGHKVTFCRQLQPHPTGALPGVFGERPALASHRGQGRDVRHRRTGPTRIGWPYPSSTPEPALAALGPVSAPPTPTWVSARGPDRAVGPGPRSPLTQMCPPPRNNDRQRCDAGWRGLCLPITLQKI